MTYVGELHYHQPSDDGEICLYDQERWPCAVQQVREKCADLISRTEDVPSMTLAGHVVVPRDLIAETVAGVHGRCPGCGECKSVGSHGPHPGGCL